jgi:hypothetical protein
MTEPQQPAQTTEPTGNEPGGGDWKPPADQAALDKIIETRLQRERQRYADYDELKATAGKYQALLATTQTDQERAIAEAKKAALDEAASQHGPRLVRQAFKAEAKGVLTKEQLDDLLEDRDLSKFLKDGEPDEEKIAALVARFAPKGDGKPEFPDLGGGNRGSSAKTTDMNKLIREAAGRGRG